MMLSPMTKALRNRKASGIDLTIIVGDPADSEDKETKELGLAPDATELPENGENEMNEDVVGNGELEAPLAAGEQMPDDARKLAFKKELMQMPLGKNSVAGRAGLLK